MDLIRCLTNDHVRLDGLWYPATGPRHPALDAVIMHHHVGGNFYAPDFYEMAVSRLTALGIVVVRVNNRGHDMVNRKTRADGRFYYLGAAFEQIDDCRRDWRAWNDVLASRGVQRLAVWGHSLGAMKSLYYASKEKDPRVAAVVATSPPRFSHAQYRTDSEEWPIFEQHLAEARALVAAGKGDTLLQVSRPASIVITARNYVEKYGPPEGHDYATMIPDIAVPVLLTLGGKEGLTNKPGSSRMSLYGARDYLRTLEQRHPHFRHVVVEGGDHWYVGVEGALADAVVGFFNGLPPR
ncbi:MAG: alpha/beta hydrolase [Alphaproteobacteria bacterium]|nr:alpha/beta hydrolase [Alphaproteobacteria bacterium]